MIFLFLPPKETTEIGEAEYEEDTKLFDDSGSCLYMYMMHYTIKHSHFKKELQTYIHH